MKTDLFTKVLLSIVAVLLFVNLLTGSFGPRPAIAEQAGNSIGKFQISSWAAYIGTYGHHSGYYVVDTTTGKVVDSHEDVHSLAK